MNLWQTLILAGVEGLTEFLPVSSTGHLILVSQLLRISQTEFVKSFEVAIQLGAILAVAVMYGRRVLRSREEMLRIAAAFLPTAGLGFIGYKLIKTFLLGNSLVTVISLAVGGWLILQFEKKFLARSGKKKIADLSLAQAAMLGVIQTTAVIPGVSRALVTIFGGLYMGLSKKEATEFSFLLAVPTMAAATGWDLLKSGWGFESGEWKILAIGTAAAAASAWAAVKWLIGFIEKHDFKAFGIYRIAAALAYLGIIGLK